MSQLSVSDVSTIYVWCLNYLCLISQLSVSHVCTIFVTGRVSAIYIVSLKTIVLDTKVSWQRYSNIFVSYLSYLHGLCRDKRLCCRHHSLLSSLPPRTLSLVSTSLPPRTLQSLSSDTTIRCTSVESSMEYTHSRLDIDKASLMRDALSSLHHTSSLDKDDMMSSCLKPIFRATWYRQVDIKSPISVCLSISSRYEDGLACRLCRERESLSLYRLDVELIPTWYRIPEMGETWYRLDDMRGLLLTKTTYESPSLYRVDLDKRRVLSPQRRYTPKSIDSPQTPKSLVSALFVLVSGVYVSYISYICLLCQLSMSHVSARSVSRLDYLCRPCRDTKVLSLGYPCLLCQLSMSHVLPCSVSRLSYLHRLCRDKRLWCRHHSLSSPHRRYRYGVATIRRLLKMVGLSCRISSLV